MMHPSISPNVNLPILQGQPVFETCEISSICAGLRMVRVSVCVDVPDKVRDDQRFLGRVRGAMGEVLWQSASPSVRADKDCTWSTPCAYQVLWRKNGDLGRGLSLPSPMAIRSDQCEELTEISVLLFGFAADYAGEISDALVRGLRQGLSSKGGQGLDPADRSFFEIEGIQPPKILHQAKLQFLTPVLFRQGREAHMELGAFWHSLLCRAAGLAVWHGQILDPLTILELKEISNRVEGSWARLDHHKWRRGAVKQGRVVPMQGATGTLALRGSLAALGPLLALGELFHVGGRTAWGQGRFEISEGL